MLQKRKRKCQNAVAAPAQNPPFEKSEGWGSVRGSAFRIFGE